MIAGEAMGEGALAVELAALLEERDILSGGEGGNSARRSIDIRLRLTAFEARDHDRALDRGAVERMRRVAAMWRRQLRIDKAASSNDRATGRLLALAYPDRIAQRRGESRGSFRLRNGRGAACDAADPLAAMPYLAVAELDGERQEARIFRAAPIAREDIEDLFGAEIATQDEIAWDERDGMVKARRRRTLDGLVLSEAALRDPDPGLMASAVIDGIGRLGLDALPWSGEAASLRARIAFMRRVDPPQQDWPDMGDTALAETLETWLAPFLAGIARRSQFGDIPLAKALAARLSWEQARRLDREAPETIQVPSGRNLRIDYAAGDVPVLPVRIQEMFGTAATPAVAGGRVPLLLHLLSPAQRPIQVTRDLVSFWRNGYPEARGDLRGRYPRHYWPDDPMAAVPTSRARARARPRSIPVNAGMLVPMLTVH